MADTEPMSPHSADPRCICNDGKAAQRDTSEYCVRKEEPKDITFLSLDEPETIHRTLSTILGEDE